MQIKEIYKSYFNDVKTRIDNAFDMYSKQSSNIIDSFEKNTVDQIENILEKKQEKEFKQELDQNLIENLQNLITELNKRTFETIKEITDKTNEVAMFTMTNPLFNIKTCDGIVKEYKLKIKEINLINKNFITSFDSSFDLFLYKVSIDYKLKESISVYNLIVKVIKQNKKILFDNLYDINNLIKNEVVKSFENNFTNFIDDSIELKEKANDKNKLILVDYSKDLLQNNATLRVNKQLKDNCNQIGELLNDCYKQALQIQKSKSNKAKQIELKELNNYFINFNNTLFDKSLNIITKMILVMDCNKKDFEKNVNRYNESIYKICNFEYSFEKQFLNYRKSLLSKSPLSNKANEEIIKLLNETEKKIIAVIKNSIIDLFKDSVTELNNVSYKTIMVEYKLKNCYEIINSKIIEKLFA